MPSGNSNSNSNGISNRNRNRNRPVLALIECNSVSLVLFFTRIEAFTAKGQLSFQQKTSLHWALSKNPHYKGPS